MDYLWPGSWGVLVKLIFDLLVGRREATKGCFLFDKPVQFNLYNSADVCIMTLFYAIALTIPMPRQGKCFTQPNTCAVWERWRASEVFSFSKSNFCPPGFILSRGAAVDAVTLTDTMPGHRGGPAPAARRSLRTWTGDVPSHHCVTVHRAGVNASSAPYPHPRDELLVLLLLTISLAEGIAVSCPVWTQGR